MRFIFFLTQAKRGKCPKGFSLRKRESKAGVREEVRRLEVKFLRTHGSQQVGHVPATTGQARQSSCNTGDRRKIDNSCWVARVIITEKGNWTSTFKGFLNCPCVLGSRWREARTHQGDQAAFVLRKFKP